LIAVTRLLKGDHAAGHCHYNRGFATSPPPLSVWGGSSSIGWIRATDRPKPYSVAVTRSRKVQ
jgi:hypothetical protein